MERIATDTYSFERIREGGFVYVDKTAILKTLADGSLGTQFFIARPRRFGKSLAVSTLQCLFEGRRDLFRGLAIEPDWDWSKTYPVIKLDMSTCAAADAQELKGLLRSMLRREAVRLGLPQPEGATPGDAFLQFCTDLAANTKGGKFVLLVDEYDKPLLGHLGKPDVNDIRDELKAFYSVIKTCEGLQRFAFMTGVSKFSKVSIFSDLNNLKDRTMTASEATLLGYTHDELKRFFPESLKRIAAANGLTPEGALAKVIKWYDGYRFDPDGEKVINPVSFGLCAEAGRFQNYWSTTALTTFLTDALKREPLDFSTIGIDQSALEAYEPENPCLVTLLYQTGYLTIEGCRQIGEKRKYTLAFPNYEVTDSFLSCLTPIYAGLGPTEATNYQFAAQEALLAGDAEKFVKALKSFFANIPYSLTDRQNEQMWQTIVYVILKAIGAAVQAEVQTNEGRIDLTCETPAGIWLVEFKLDRPAEEALAQIDEKNYAEKYDFAGKAVKKIGISFSSEKRTIADWRMAEKG